MEVSVGTGVPLGIGEGVKVRVGSVVAMIGAGTACAQAVRKSNNTKAVFLIPCGQN
jgi:hypothetical protein